LTGLWLPALMMNETILITGPRPSSTVKVSASRKNLVSALVAGLLFHL
jgi:hypothetical protein